MDGTFLLEDEMHRAGDPACPACLSEYPEPCPCGGLIHAASGLATDDEDVETVSTTRCDQCGRSEDDVVESAA